MKEKDKQLFKGGDEEAILRVERDFYTLGKGIYELDAERLKCRAYAIPDGPPFLIKMLSRHEMLGLPDVDPSRKKDLQKFLEIPNAPYNSWLCCSALRAGFVLPPMSTKYIDGQIRVWIEQEKILLARALDEIVAFNPPLKEKIKTNRAKFIFERYLSTVHHLYRLLGLSAP